MGEREEGKRKRKGGMPKRRKEEDWGERGRKTRGNIKKRTQENGEKKVGWRPSRLQEKIISHTE